MNTIPNIHAMIVAAGRGSRFGASIAKQYTMLEGQTLLQHSVARLAYSDYIDKCLLVISADDSTAQQLEFALPVRYAVGGAERWQSVQSGVEAISQTGADDSDLVLIHDAARPAVPSSDIDQVIEAAMLEPYGAILATPVPIR
nr:2-C-methyl-D-erythritol 4-phosphate cytidylyltransferase [Psychrobacter sp. JCM 18901]